MWIARNKNGKLFAYTDKPKWNGMLKSFITSSNRIELYDTEFPEITFENSPKEITKSV